MVLSVTLVTRTRICRVEPIDEPIAHNSFSSSIRVMLANWSFVAVAEFTLLPMSMVFLFLLVLPVGKTARKHINNFLTKVFFFPTIGTVPLIATIVTLLALYFISKVHWLYHNIYHHRPSHHATADAKHFYESKRLRAERDFHIALLLLVFWVLLYMMLHLSKRLQQSEHQVSTLRTALDDLKLVEQRNRSAPSQQHAAAPPRPAQPPKVAPEQVDAPTTMALPARPQTPEKSAAITTENKKQD